MTSELEECVNAATAGDLETIRRLVPGTLAPDTLDDRGNSLLCIAAIWCRLQVVEYLVEAGALVDGPDPAHPTPLMFAATSPDSLEVVRHLLRSGADPNREIEDRMSPLRFCIYSPDSVPEVLEALLAAGADPLRVYDGGRTVAAETPSRLRGTLERYVDGRGASPDDSAESP
jgi:ankyrin repeat protein